MDKTVENLLHQLDDLIRQQRYQSLETDTVEIKPVPSTGHQWTEVFKSANAFLNTRGGLILLGVKEEQRPRGFVFTGWKEQNENNVRELPLKFTDKEGKPLDLSEAFRSEVVPFQEGQIAIIYVDELAADRKFVFLPHGDRLEAFRRSLTGDARIPEDVISRQEEFREEASHATELELVPDLSFSDLDLDKLNDYITQLNRPVRIETVKASLEDARAFLDRKCFVKDGRPTTLGVLVCGKYPSDWLGFRCHVHAYVDVPQEIARDKQDFADNIIPLMEKAFNYLLRNIRIGITPERGGTSAPEYPEDLLRETVNNALAHRNYSANKQVIVAIKPGVHICIKNPGSFRPHLIVRSDADNTPVRRIIPEAKARNPKLADVLRVYRKWEGRGIGMATLVGMCLGNQIDVPYYTFGTEDVSLYLPSGQLVDERMERFFQSYDRYLQEKMQGDDLSTAQKAVLAYVLKSQWHNDQERYTILLTPDNNHLAALRDVEKARLIRKHPASLPYYPVYVADPVLASPDNRAVLRQQLGIAFDSLKPLAKDILAIVHRFNTYSSTPHVNARQTAFTLWYEKYSKLGTRNSLMEFDGFLRKVRYEFNSLETEGFVAKEGRRSGFVLAKPQLLL